MCWPQSQCWLCLTPRSVLSQPGPSALLRSPAQPSPAPPHLRTVASCPPPDTPTLRTKRSCWSHPFSSASSSRGPGFSLPCPHLSFQPRLPTPLPAPAEPSEVLQQATPLDPASHAPRPLALDTASPSLLTAFPPAPSLTSDKSSRPRTSAPQPCAGPFVPPPDPRRLPSRSCSCCLVNRDASTLAFDGELLGEKKI